MKIAETFFDVNQQTMLFLWSCVIGVVIGLCYDFFRVARIIFPHHKSLVLIEDTCFIVFCSTNLFVFTVELAQGQMRFFIFAGALLGFIVYHFTVGMAVVTLTRKLVRLIHKFALLAIKLLKKVFAPVFQFFRWIYQKLCRRFVKFISILKKLGKNFKKGLKKHSKVLYNKSTHKQRHTNRGNVKNAIKGEEFTVKKRKEVSIDIY